ncbi:MAG: VWA domain-containing protein [Pyrinomonadaceae bacterium]
MKYFLHAACCLILFVSAAISQNPKPNPTPVDDNDIVKITTSLIQVDVSVTDSRGRIVSDLTPDEIEIYENGKKQEITNFSFISAESTESNPVRQTKTKDGLLLPPARTALKPEQIRRTIALVVDDLTLSFESMYYVKRALRNFVEEQMQDGDLVAIIKSSGGAGALQQFTNDKRKLLSTIEKIKWSIRGSGKISAFEPYYVAQGDLDELEENEDLGPRHKEESLDDFRASAFSTGTLGAVRYVVKGMDELPGRKSIMLLSDGFSIFGKGGNGFVDSTRILERVRKLIDDANRSSVVIYTMDARGLQTLGFTAADSLGIIGLSPDSKPINPHRLETLSKDRRDKLFDSQEGLTMLAEETGGLAIRNTNDLNGGIRTMLKDQSYYLIGYQPDSETFNPETRKFNKLDIRVTRKDLNVRFRSGFFGVEDKDTPAIPADLPANNRIMSALLSPFANNDLNLGLSAVFKSNEDRELFVNTYIHIKGSELGFKDSAAGTKDAAFDLLMMNFDENGVPTDTVSKTFTINATDDTYKEIIADGFVYYATFRIKNPGAYQMRVAIRDHSTNRVGSASQYIEIPRLKKNRIVLSGIVVDNISYDAWDQMNSGPNSKSPDSPIKPEDNSTAMTDTAVRRFKNGSILSYAFEVYNTQYPSAQGAQMTSKTRLFNGEKLVYEGKEVPVDKQFVTRSNVHPVIGAISLGTDMEQGDYVLQIIVTSRSSKNKEQIASQFIPFEIVE